MRAQSSSVPARPYMVRFSVSYASRKTMAIPVAGKPRWMAGSGGRKSVKLSREPYYTTIYKLFARWSDDGSLDQAFIASVRHLAEQHHLDLSILHGDGSNTVAKKGGDGIGYSGHKHQKGEKVLAIVDNNGFVLAPLPVAPVNEADTVLLPDGLNALKRVARLTGLEIEGASLNLDGGFDSRRNRKAIFNAGLVPNVKENPRNRKAPKTAFCVFCWG